ncbi:MAG: hypothetical protein LBE13_04535 [Bacteroidales bacterium]|jgi:hypothetical protein|nr:hypothetical protein [Bacteroidales bacterium]
MKNWRISVFLLMFAGVILIACDKYDSKIIGKVNYIDVNDNRNYPAAGAIITKMAVDGDSLRSVASVVANENGEFLFDHTTKGSWKLSGKIEKDTILYWGLSEQFSTNGSNQIEQIILLEPVPKDTSE